MASKLLFVTGYVTESGILTVIYLEKVCSIDAYTYVSVCVSNHSVLSDHPYLSGYRWSFFVLVLWATRLYLDKAGSKLIHRELSMQTLCDIEKQYWMPVIGQGATIKYLIVWMGTVINTQLYGY